jgi:hypothetical protein
MGIQLVIQHYSYHCLEKLLYDVVIGLQLVIQHYSYHWESYYSDRKFELILLLIQTVLIVMIFALSLFWKGRGETISVHVEYINSFGNYKLQTFQF